MKLLSFVVGVFSRYWVSWLSKRSVRWLSAHILKYFVAKEPSSFKRNIKALVGDLVNRASRLKRLLRFLLPSISLSNFFQLRRFFHLWQKIGWELKAVWSSFLCDIFRWPVNLIFFVWKLCVLGLILFVIFWGQKAIAIA